MPVKNEPQVLNNRPRLGRPRALSLDSGGDVANDILMRAARLFAVQGYDGTSTREIAAAVGLRQPSIFHYFETKADILKALAKELCMTSMAEFNELSKTAHEPGPNLYAAVFLNARHLAEVPDIARTFARFPRGAEETIRELQQSRGVLLTHMKEILKDGQRQHIFRAGDHEVYAQFTLGLVESIIDPRFPVMPPVQHAELVAQHAVRAVLQDQHMITDIIAKGASIVASIDQAMSRR